MPMIQTSVTAHSNIADIASILNLSGDFPDTITMGKAVEIVSEFWLEQNRDDYLARKMEE